MSDEQINGEEVLDDLPQAEEVVAETEAQAGAEVAPETKVETTREALDPTLINRAIRAGMDYQDVQSFPSNTSLGRTVHNLENLLSKSSKPEVKEEKPKFKLELPPALEGEAYTPEEIARDKAWRASMEAIAKHNEELEERFGELKGNDEKIQNDLVQQEQTRRVSQFDGKIKALGGDFAPELGTGNYDSPTLTNAQAKTRNEIWVATDIFQSVLGWNFDRAFDAATRGVLADKFDRTAVKTVTSKMQSRSKARTFQGAGTKPGEVISEKLSDDKELKAAFAKMKAEDEAR